jgi:uncharacterized phage protein (TIGR02218 family)
MRTLSGPFAAMIAGETTTLARVMKFILPNGQEFYYTNHDKDLVFDGDTYINAHAFDPSSVETSIGGDSSNFTFDLMLADDGVTSEMIEVGLTDNASVEYYLVDHTAPNTSNVRYFKGTVSNVKINGKLSATFEITPLSLSQEQLAKDSFSQLCRADFGDAACKFDIESTAFLATISSVDNRQVFTTDNSDIDNYWNGGVAVFTSGDNDTFGFEIGKSEASGKITLRLLTPFTIQVGDTVKLLLGCAKTIGACLSYNNVVNYRGEPLSANVRAFSLGVPASTSGSTGSGTGVVVGKVVT